MSSIIENEQQTSLKNPVEKEHNTEAENQPKPETISPQRSCPVIDVTSPNKDTPAPGVLPPDASVVSGAGDLPLAPVPIDNNGNTFGSGTCAAGQLTTRKKGWPRGRKRRCLPKDAPKAPLSGYMLYMADQREQLRHSKSPPSFAELAKIVAHKWAAMDSAEKQKYLEASELEKERYQKELSAYTKTDSYKNFLEQQKKQEKSQQLAEEESGGEGLVPSKAAKDETSCPQDSKRPRRDCTPISSPFVPSNGVTHHHKEDLNEINFYNSAQLQEIPIFTEQFLKHNQAREAELRQLRKSNTDYEEQNALLEKHIESTRLSVERYESETAELRKKTSALEQHLTSLRRDLVRAFSDTPAPGWTSPPNDKCIDEYLMCLHAALTASPPAALNRATQQTVQQIVTSLILH
ncbi:High mobility group box domain [Trinorchestia longiramus]|nr:High mobility group box domain [Trinorchestia longiramus]